METITSEGTVTSEQVRRATQDLWDAFTNQAKERFQEFYSPTATCFAADGRRSEAARLMWVRREREFFGPKSSVGAKLGVVSVQILTPTLAVASYPFHFSIIRVMPNGSRAQVEVPFVFQRGQNGKLTLSHEHFSSAEPTVTKTLSSDPNR